MTRKTPSLHCALLVFLAAANVGAAQAGWVHYDANHTLVYSNDDLGNRLPDFSYAGYEGGGVALPVVPVKVAVSPVGGDNTANIQNAIDTVSALTTDANGFRGAVLLQPGTYTIAGALAIWEPMEKKRGRQGVAAIVDPKPFIKPAEDKQAHLLLVRAGLDHSIDYWAGFAREMAGKITTPEALAEIRGRRREGRGVAD